ncbi:hypothetical protein Baya_5200 [Bagarius yarrelli]|uniref:Uncharacterized protein n=1 Tax=Bagarius yarrelli TaxID=175774 RepID=A0A556TTU8_BAGYA|nr:hypothetical protein Baya_5200 [Bagarius yarrelli]
MKQSLISALVERTRYQKKAVSNQLLGKPVRAERKVEHLPSIAEFVYVSTHLLDGAARPLRSEYNAVTISINQHSASWGTSKASRMLLPGFSRVSLSPHPNRSAAAANVRLNIAI